MLGISRRTLKLKLKDYGINSYADIAAVNQRMDDAGLRIPHQGKNQYRIDSKPLILLENKDSLANLFIADCQADPRGDKRAAHDFINVLSHGRPGEKRNDLLSANGI